MDGIEIKMYGLNNGKYNLFNNELYFDIKGAKLGNYTLNDRLTIDKSSALEITHTLLDSLNLLDNNTEELLCEIEERIRSGIK